MTFLIILFALVLTWMFSAMLEGQHDWRIYALVIAILACVLWPVQIT